MKLTLATPPVTEPITVSEAKSHLRVDFADDDTLIGTLITAARKKAEDYLWRAVLTQTYDLFLDEFPCGDRIRLPRPPLASVTGVYYTPDGSSEQTFSSANYHVDNASEPGGVVLKLGYTWPSDTLQAVNGVRVRFVAGWSSAANVPATIVAAIKLIIGHLYENREGVVVGQGISITQLPGGIEWLLDGERCFSFAIDEED